ncbi:unnamed protein product [Paramecium sonneborni]|uniref:EF-hand domain-containing protein n=1 Tax=Paramecium sonneborni TaxID=65129 RepID=A0A8S1PJN6_9CILI|nr:unnamed protein product [Paramecium sonneborni]
MDQLLQLKTWRGIKESLYNNNRDINARNQNFQSNQYFFLNQFNTINKRKLFEYLNPSKSGTIDFDEFADHQIKVDQNIKQATKQQKFKQQNQQFSDLFKRQINIQLDFQILELLLINNNSVLLIFQIILRTIKKYHHQNIPLYKKVG